MLPQGTDIPDVDDVIHFMAPETLSVWMQRAGRAGRDGRQSRAILLVEPSVAGELAAKSSKGRKHSKDVSEGSFTLPHLWSNLSLTEVEVRRQALKTTSGRTDDSDSDSDESDDDDDSSRDAPTSDWEEFDADAAHKKKQVDPETRQWALTEDCRRIISDAFFNNPSRNQGMHNPSPRNQSDHIIFSMSVGPVLR